jgi:excinuclease UvrABC nuclease subunit
MITPEFLQYKNRGSDGYVRANEVFDRNVLKQFLEQFSKQKPEIDEEYVENVLASFDILCFNFPKTPSEIPNDLPRIEGMEEVNEKLDNEWGDFQKDLIDEIIDKGQEEFPLIVDLVIIDDIVIGVELTDKKRNLEESMDVFIEQEEYEKAAEIRDELEELGSDKVRV